MFCEIAQSHLHDGARLHTVSQLFIAYSGSRADSETKNVDSETKHADSKTKTRGFGSYSASGFGNYYALGVANWDRDVESGERMILTHVFTWLSLCDSAHLIAKRRKGVVLTYVSALFSLCHFMPK